MENKWKLFFVGILFLWSIGVISFACKKTEISQSSYQGLTVAAPYSYHLSGRTDRIRGYVVKIDDTRQLTAPGLVFLASGLAQGEGYVEINGERFDLPAITGELSAPSTKDGKNVPGKEGWYSFSSGDDIVGKLEVPLPKELLKQGVNEVTYYRNPDYDGFEIIDTRIENVNTTVAQLIGQTYHLLGRGKSASINDFDYVNNYKGEKKRLEKDIPDWSRRGKVFFYRTGIDWDHLDRMFELFKEARINVVAVNVPKDKSTPEFQRTKDFIDRCHDNKIQVTAFNSLGNIGLREMLMNPELEKWIARDEYGALRWRGEPGGNYAADLKNLDYRHNDLLIQVGNQLDLGVDELYFDWAIGGTGDILDFFGEVRDLAQRKGKNIAIFGNCKGNILADEACDLTKSEGTTEAGVWNGKWVHNIAQARFYYASGDGVKPYESKYEGADPGVANPGAMDVREGMKCGWRKPIAEASAFQSHFAIAESGDKMRQGWIMKDNPLAMQIWSDICSYFNFLADNQDMYTDVRTVSKLGVLSPPQIPSFEVTLKRDILYNTLAENNIMFEVILLPRLSLELISHYRALLIPNIPWIENEQLEILKIFKSRGGKIYTIGSDKSLQDLADIVSHPSIFLALEQGQGKKEFLDNIKKVEGDPIVSLSGVQYVATNTVRKVGTDRIILHLVNYDKQVHNVQVLINLDGIVPALITPTVQMFSPDQVARDVKNLSVKGNQVNFTIPDLDVYDVITIN
jgi:hypothetical protein